MRKILLSLLLIFLLVGCHSNEPTFRDTQGHTIKFSQFRGKWVILNYWAKWCHSCQSEIAEFNAFYRKYQDKIVVIGVSYDILPEPELKHVIQDFKIEYPILMQNPADYLQIDAINFVPTTIIINPRGRVVQQLAGPQTVRSLSEATHVE